jgi:hypothetical protein
LDHAIGLVASFIFLICAAILELVGLIDGFLASLMARAGIPPNAQVALLLAISIIIVIAAVRKLGTLISVLIIVLLVLLMLHKVLPGKEIGPVTLPGNLQSMGTVHT